MPMKNGLKLIVDSDLPHNQSFAFGQGSADNSVLTTKKVITGADQTGLYLNYLKGKNIGMVVNQTSVIGSNLTSSVDSLLKLSISIKKIFGPGAWFQGERQQWCTRR